MQSKSAEIAAAPRRQKRRIGRAAAAPELTIPNSVAKMLVMRLRILIADTDRQSADLLAESLRHVGQSPHVCYSESECLDLLAHVRPEVVFLDVAMQALCSEIRERMHPEPVELIGLTPAPQ